MRIRFAFVFFFSWALTGVAADDVCFDLNKEQLWLNLAVPDASGTHYPEDACSRGYEKVSWTEFTNVLVRISKMTRLREFRFAVLADERVLMDLSFLAAQTNLTNLCLGGSIRVATFAPLKRLPLAELDFSFGGKGVVIEDEASIGELSILREFRANEGFKSIAALPPSLEILDMSAAPSGDYCGAFTNLVNLVHLRMDTIFGKVQYISEDDIRAMCKLKYLSLNEGFEGVPLSALSTCASLEELELCFMKFRPVELSALGALPLKKLTIKECLVHDVKGLEKCPLSELSIDFCPISSLEDFGMFPNVRTMKLIRTGVRHVEKADVLRHFPNIWLFVHGDLQDGFCDEGRCNQSLEFGPQDIVFSTNAGNFGSGSFLGFDMDRPILYDDEAFSLSEVMGHENDCVMERWHESVVGLGRPYHGFESVKLIGKKSDGPVDALVFECRSREEKSFDDDAEAEWVRSLAAEMKAVYGASFKTKNREGFVLVEGTCDKFEFTILSQPTGSQESIDGETKWFISHEFHVRRRHKEAGAAKDEIVDYH